MPPTASEPAATYRFAFSWEGPYGKAVNLVSTFAPKGLVLDLGCGYGAVAEVLLEKGRDYVGADLDQAAVADLTGRGLEAHLLDLADPRRLAEHLAQITAGRHIGAVLLLDAIEHLPDPPSTLSVLAGFARSANTDGAPPPVLVTSIPNVAHVDLAAKLVAGRFDMTESGLLDRTHLQFFTEARMTAELGRHGLVELGRDDVLLDRSDQNFPVDHPYLVAGGPVYEHLRALRAAAGPNETVNQFVRAYALREGAEPEAPSAPLLRKPLLSVLTRTDGNRPGMLTEALACLAAQSLQDFEVLLLVHSDSAEVLAACKELVDSFDEAFCSRVRLLQVAAGGGGRAVPLNAGLKAAVGRYVAFLDDDDLVTADWAEAFAGAIEAAPGRIVRSGCLGRHVRKAGGGEEQMGDVPVTLSRPLAEFGDGFDLLAHFATNSTPILSVAIPRALFSELGLVFDETYEVCEDWELLLRAGLLVGVRDTGRVTCVYQRWDDAGTTTATTPASSWAGALSRMVTELDKHPLLLPTGIASKIAYLVADPELGEKRSLAVELADTRRVLEETRADLAAAEARAAEAEQAHEEIASSEFWRITAPLRVPLSRLAARRRGSP